MKDFMERERESKKKEGKVIEKVRRDQTERERKGQREAERRERESRRGED